MVHLEPSSTVADPCAIKLLHQVAMEMQTSIPATKNDDASNAIDRESDFLKHPNVVQFLTTAKHPKSGGTILVVELMDCCLRSYFSSLGEESLTSKCEISLSKDMACGLAYIDSKQIIHRDLCGDNVLLKLTQPVPRFPTLACHGYTIPPSLAPPSQPLVTVGGIYLPRPIDWTRRNTIAAWMCFPMG